MLNTAEAKGRREELLRELKALQEQIHEKYGVLSDSTPGIREEREARG